MSLAAPVAVHARKAPQQARSAVTVEAIQAATIQVLLAVGASRLTTTRVAERAGVSVGTMYQYYPNKQALLFAIVQRQLEGVERAFVATVEQLEGRDLESIGHGLAHAWLDAKTVDVEASRAIYGTAAEFDITGLMEQGAARLRDAVRQLLASASDARVTDIDNAAFMLLAMLSGSVRTAMEAGAYDEHLACLRQELPSACYGYLKTKASDSAVAESATSRSRRRMTPSARRHRCLLC